MGSQRGQKGQLFPKRKGFASQSLIVGCVIGTAITGIQPAKAQDSQGVIAGEAVASQSQQENSAYLVPEEAINRLSEIDHPASTVAEWIAQLQIEITGVELNPTESGLELVLTTAGGELPPVSTSVVGNALIADIPNAVLSLPEGSEFQEIAPAEGIAAVAISSRSDGVRIVITGTNAPPVADVRTDGRSLLLSVSTGAATTTQTQEGLQITATGEQNNRYYTPEASTATRTDTPLRDIPASIQVIPQQVLEDQGIVEYRDALENIGGITLDGQYGGTDAGSIIIRGFSQDTNFRNGFRNNNFYSIAETANIQQIEVLRGPASILYGLTQPGGIVNIVTEQPLPDPYYSVEFTGGQFSFYRPEIDISGPLTEDEDLLYRLNLAYQNSGSFRDFVNDERFFIAPVLQWNLSDATSLTLEGEYLYDNPVFDRGLTALSDGSLVLPIDRFLGYPQLDEFFAEQYRIGYRFEHEFNENWRFRNAGSIFSVWQGGRRADNNGGLLDDRFMQRELRDDASRWENYGIQAEVIGEFNTGAIAHQLLIGVDFSRFTNSYNSFSADLTPLDIFNPNYDIPIPTDLQLRYYQTTLTNDFGIYVQDQIDLLDNLHLLVGGRLDFADQFQNFAGTISEQSDTAFSPRLGIVYQPIEPLSLYASFSRSFLPVVGRSASGEAFDPERGTQYEVGVRADINENISFTLAAYHLTKTNVLTNDPDDPDFSIQVGEQRSQGIEFNAIGEILPGWNVIASYAYTDAEITEDNTLPEGSRLANVAEHTASVWTTYEIQEGNLQGLGFGFGLFFVDDRPGYAGFDPPEFELPSFVRADAAVYYRRDNWRAQLNVENLFDVEYYETHQGSDIVYPGAPFNVRASISYTF
ncbi:TonB-dependent siderophore receptor [Oscillatoria sp. FACHB-1407]|uniref:TonB-dependent siderophore receptor n=1 Tax=Oscillatoria sp. FACHB-1407 TaxID=2692847 RepID=UPI00168365B0|nr:TonB-dependent siderophore receptor [Oscillatoria sp. FACHB-1407]MBD2463170.1 TonB-dependent siderophore receptor [Oscillatoria sp. FACHB-1407]